MMDGSDMTEGWVESRTYVYGCPMEGHETLWFGTWDDYIAHIDAEHPEPWTYRQREKKTEGGD